MSTAAAKMPGPAKGVKPHLDGVPGVFCDEAPPDVLFGQKNLRTSPYDPLLLQLQRAGAGKFLKFDDLRARVSLIARAKKLNIKIMFGEQGNTLWVTLAKAEIESTGVVEKQEEKTATAHALILQAIAAKRTTAGEITTWLRSNGVPGAGISLVDALISSLARAGKIKLNPKRVPGEDAPERWILA